MFPFLFPSFSSWPVHFFPLSMIFTSGPREIFAMNPRFECCLQRRDILSKADRINVDASSPSGTRCDAEEPKPRSDDGLFLELVVPNSVVAGNDDPAVEAGFS